MDRNRRRLQSQLCKAVIDGEPRSVQMLLSQGASPDMVGSKGVAAIHLAVGKETEKSTRSLKLMLQHGADPNVKSSEGLTPLHVAALWGCYQNLKLLLMNGGNPSIKDHEGNTPGRLAEQQENRKCAQLIQEYQASSVDAEDEDLPQFQYSVYSDQMDTSSYPDSDFSFSSHLSRMSDFGEAQLSSTRRSSFLDLSAINVQPSCGEVSCKRLSSMEANKHHNQVWDKHLCWPYEGPSILSSTRMSIVGSGAAMPVLQEDVMFTDDSMLTSKANSDPATAEGRTSMFRKDAPTTCPSRRASRKSVSFQDVDEYFPVFSPESHKTQRAIDTGQHQESIPFSEFSDFLDSERMATVTYQQGIDVTSPDHVYIFCRDSSESTEEDMEKTIISPFLLGESKYEKEDENENVAGTGLPEQPACSSQGGSSSGTSSHYSSCESDHYTSAMEASLYPRLTPPLEKEIPAGDESVKETQISPVYDSTFKKSPSNDVPGICHSPEQNILDTSETDVNKVAVRPVAHTPEAGAAAALEEDSDLPLIPSPFVTGRTRSRLSRCSLRTSRTPESLLSTSSLFDKTLPTPIRTRRQTPRSQSRNVLDNSPCGTCYTPSYSGSSTGSTGGECLPSECQDTQSSTLRASVGISQADTLILSRNVADSIEEPQSLSDTIILEKKVDSSTDAYEKNLQEIILAMQGKGLAEGEDFMTDDLTSTDEATTKVNLKDVPVRAQGDSLENEDAWITEDCGSQANSVASSSSSSYFSPRKSREESDPPCTPGTGCTPRYSMSRLSSCRRPRHLANLSYTPGGRPVIQDLDEPVEYLYTDIEQGHKLIETHVPPTVNSSLSSSMNTSTSDETILYDWRSMRVDLMKSKGKENQKPTKVPTEENDEKEDRLLQETRGITDKELRHRLLELGESPGPISSRTRPTYMKRLRHLLLESNSRSPPRQKQMEQSQPDMGYAPELCQALQTFELPDCHTDELALCQQFDQPDQNRKWREGIIKSSFNYLLLDPRVTKNLPFRSRTLTPQECFQTFVSAIFYVGKGKRSRPYSHLYEALEYHTGDKTSKKLCSKVQHILQVWSAGLGVISLHCFQNVIPVEAYTREACMVDAIGLNMLTNQKRGDYYGLVSNWPVKRRRELGVHLLYRAMQIFLAEGERQLRPCRH
ncbi:uncharacterized protein LOC115358288 [Myripristis murdjan]|uniref:LEM domain-containing protein n=1 Tax=Myripristis murdjan TaxID=586833 RepID=A0A667XR93_9TELE|nr:ankyrin repeat and LEM domain-containing protein 1 [Myripristis murdjan]